MNVFEILIRVSYKSFERTEVRTVASNHLQGAIRKLYQQESYPFEIKKILKG